MMLLGMVEAGCVLMGRSGYYVGYVPGVMSRCNADVFLRCMLLRGGVSICMTETLPPSSDGGESLRLWRRKSIVFDINLRARPNSH